MRYRIPNDARKIHLGIEERGTIINENNTCEHPTSWSRGPSSKLLLGGRVHNVLIHLNPHTSLRLEAIFLPFSRSSAQRGDAASQILWS